MQAESVRVYLRREDQVEVSQHGLYPEIWLYFDVSTVWLVVSINVFILRCV